MPAPANRGVVRRRWLRKRRGFSSSKSQGCGIRESCRRGIRRYRRFRSANKDEEKRARWKRAPHGVRFNRARDWASNYSAIRETATKGAGKGENAVS